MSSRKYPPKVGCIPAKIPEEPLRKLSQTYNLKQVIVIGLEEDSGISQLASYGRNRQEQKAIDKLLDTLREFLADHDWPPPTAAD